MCGSFPLSSYRSGKNIDFCIICGGSHVLCHFLGASGAGEVGWCVTRTEQLTDAPGALQVPPGERSCHLQERTLSPRTASGGCPARCPGQIPSPGTSAAPHCSRGRGGLGPHTRGTWGLRDRGRNVPPSTSPQSPPSAAHPAGAKHQLCARAACVVPRTSCKSTKKKRETPVGKWTKIGTGN